MATAHLTTYHHRDSTATPAADGVCMTSAMFGAVGGALAAVTAFGSSFEYAAVLAGTCGVVMGSVLAGIAGRFLILPVYEAFRGRQS